MKHLVVVGLLGLAACKPAANGADAEKAIKTHFEQFHAVTSVKCPSTIKMEAGAEFECDLVFGDGGKWHVGGKVTKTSDQGANFDFKIKETFFDPTPVAAWIAGEAKKQTNTDLKVECGWPRAPKAEETCKVTLPDGKTTEALVLVAEDGTPKSFEIKPL
jgi:hypothetical protein